MIKFLIPTLFLFSGLNAQTIIENKKDEFTGHHVKRTSWETMLQWYKCVYFQGQKIDDSVNLNFKFTDCSVIAIPEGNSLMIKLANDSIIKLSTPHTISCRGCGVPGHMGSDCYGVDISVFPSQSQLQLLKSIEIVKVRVYTTQGFIDCDIPKKNGGKLTKVLALLN